MKWIPRLLALFILLPAVELMLLLQFHRWTGFWATVGLILGTGILGGYLARREGTSAWRRVQERLNSAQVPGTELIDGVIILVAGVLLITPGVLSDILGLVGLLPPTRAVVRRLVLRKLEQGRQQGTVRFYAPAPPGRPAPEPNDETWQGAPRPTPRHARDGSDG